MTGFIDAGEAKAAARSLKQAAQEVSKAKADLHREEGRRLSLQGQTHDPRAEGAYRQAQEAVSRVDERHRNAREKAQRILSDIRRALSAGRQDLGALSRGASEIRTGQDHVQRAAQARRQDMQTLQSLERELQAALQAPTTQAGLEDRVTSSFSGSDGSPFLTESHPGGLGGTPSSSPSLGALEEAIRGASSAAGKSPSSSPSRSGLGARPQSASEDFDPYNLPGWQKYIWQERSRNNPEAAFEEEMAQRYYYYKRNVPLGLRATYAWKYAQYYNGVLNDGGRGFSGKYEV